MQNEADDRGTVRLLLEAGIAWITIDRPKRLNALNQQMRSQIETAVRQAELASDVRVVVLAGGERAFVAGADIEELIDLDAAGALALSRSIAALHGRLEALPVPVIAAIRGWCLGGGLELALAADMRIASETARFGLPELTLGILPGGGGIARLMRTVGSAAAAQLCLTGRVIEARRAAEIGLVAEVCSSDAFDARIRETAEALAGLSRPAVQAMKAALRGGHLPLAEAIEAEARLGARLYGTGEQRRAMADFLAARTRRQALR